MFVNDLRREQTPEWPIMKFPFQSGPVILSAAKELNFWR